MLADGGWKFDEALSWYTNGKTAKLAEAIDKSTHSGNVLAYCGSKGDLLKYEGFAEVQRLRAEGKLPRPSWENNGSAPRKRQCSRTKGIALIEGGLKIEDPTCK